MFMDPYTSKAIKFARIRKQEWDKLIEWRERKDLDTSGFISLRVYGFILLGQRNNPDLALADSILDTDETTLLSQMPKKSY